MRTKRATKILFLFSGASNRRKIAAQVAQGENADTGLRGSNYIAGADFIDVEETVRALMPAWAYRLLPWQARSICLFFRVRHYDVIIAQDDLLLGYVISASRQLFHTQSRWIGIVVNSSILIRRHKSHPLRLLLLKTVWKSFSKIICLSSAQQKDLVQLGLPHEKLVCVPFGIDAGFFASVSRSREENLVVSVGRDLGRDYETLLAAAKLSQRPFVVVAARKNIDATMSVPPNVSLLFDLSMLELRDLYARARLVVIASKQEESSDGSDCSGQTVILDAMAAGVPVVATARPWITDYFTPEEDIVVVEPGNAKALAAAVERVLRDDERRARMVMSGRAKVRERYTTEAFASALERVIQTVI